MASESSEIWLVRVSEREPVKADQWTRKSRLVRVGKVKASTELDKRPVCEWPD